LLPRPEPPREPPRDAAPVPRERDVPVAVRDAVLRLAVLRLDLLPPVTPPSEPADDARLAPARVALPRLAVAFLPAALLPRPPPDFAEDARALPLVLPRPPDEEPDELSSLVHLPDSTRCAASATASAMMEPSLAALETMLVAALDAVSAASSPASRILRRAAGLALIAAAAAARPAASISLLIAALVKLSTVSFEMIEDSCESWLGRFAMKILLPLLRKRHMTAVTVP
jgi:hypothetical protein